MNNEKTLMRGSDCGIDYACTLDRVASVLGISRQGAWTIEQRALRKLRARSVDMRLLHAMASELAKGRYLTQKIEVSK